jgi:BirA family transcriptional regulator, biotin operon repressor / biotin---[acetyl-CoA-carboxylase] ligase
VSAPGQSACSRRPAGHALGRAQPRLALGHPRVHLRLTDSTNNRARELALAGAPHGTLVTAREQTAGRGRGGRRWSAPPGSSLLMSLLLRSPPRLLPLIAAVAVCEVAGEQAQIKWPNDVVLARPTGLAKLAGILAEGRPEEGWAVLGIGLNVAVRIEQLPAELEGRAATLGRSAAEVEPTLAKLLRALARWLECSERETLAAWRERDVLRGRAIGWATGQGRAQGIDGDGRLVVALAGGGLLTLDAGEVHLRQVG